MARHSRNRKRGNRVSQSQSNPTGVASARPATQLEFLWKTHSYTNEYIRFADPKAGILIALAGGLIAAMFSAKCHHYCYPNTLSWERADGWSTFLGTCSVVSFVLLGICVVMNAWAVAPRLWRTFIKGVVARFQHTLTPQQAKPGFIFWEEVILHGSAAEYLKAVKGLTDEGMVEAVATHVYVLAGVANEKYKWIKYGVYCGYAGAGFACLVLLMSA
jgi:hypothetical protein